jgi:hypothetical protein
VGTAAGGEGGTRVSERPPGARARGPEGPSPYRRWFWAIDAAIVLYLALDVVAQLLPPHYSPISQAESDLAVGPYGWIMTLNFLDRGAFSLAFAYAFPRAVGSSGRAWGPFRPGIALVALWGLGSLVLAAFPTDVPPTPVSPHGAVHLVVALLAFLAAALGVYLVTRRFRGSDLLRPATAWALPLAVVVVLTFLLEAGLPFLSPHLEAHIGGATERLFLGAVLVWMFAVSTYLATRPRGPPVADPTPGPDPSAPRSGSSSEDRSDRSRYGEGGDGVSSPGSSSRGIVVGGGARLQVASASTRR